MTRLFELEVGTSQRSQMVDVTERVQEAVSATAVEDGVCQVYVPHTTCAVTVNEGADPDVQHDFLQRLAALVPEDGAYRHGEGNSDSHIKSMLVGTQVTLPVERGRLKLGRWQAVFLCEFDGPRRRNLWVTIR